MLRSQDEWGAPVPGSMAQLAAVRDELAGRRVAAAAAAATAAPASTTAASGSCAGAGIGGSTAHRGEFQLLEQLAPGVLQCRWTDDGGLLRDAPCLVPAPAGALRGTHSAGVASWGEDRKGRRGGKAWRALCARGKHASLHQCMCTATLTRSTSPF